MIKKYRKKQHVTLVIKWDDSKETLDLINQEFCSKLEDCRMYRLPEPNANTMVIKTMDKLGTNKSFVRNGDNVVYDPNRKVMPVFNVMDEYLNEEYEQIQ